MFWNVSTLNFVANPAPKPKPLTLLTVAIGGGLGALARAYLPWPTLSGTDSVADFLPTLIVNLIGAILLGFIAGFTTKRAWPEALQHGVTVGFLGSFTTMSALALSVSVLSLTLPDASDGVILEVLGWTALCLAVLIGFLILTTALTVASYRAGNRWAGA